MDGPNLAIRVLAGGLLKENCIYIPGYQKPVLDDRLTMNCSIYG